MALAIRQVGTGITLRGCQQQPCGQSLMVTSEVGFAGCELVQNRLSVKLSSMPGFELKKLGLWGRHPGSEVGLARAFPISTAVYSPVAPPQAEQDSTLTLTTDGTARLLVTTNGSVGNGHVSISHSPKYGLQPSGVTQEALACHILDRPTKKQVCLFYCSETEELARRIASDSDCIELRSISWGQFPDGFPNLFVPNAHGIRGRHVAFLASFSSPAVIFEQLSIIYALPRMFVSSFTLVLPFFPTGTVERMEDEGDVATAFTLSRILSNIPISRGGPTSLVIFDIHALQERFYFGDNVLPCFESGIPLLKHRLHQLPDAENVSIAFPDEGAWKRFHRQLQHYPTIICTKVRDGNERIVRLKEGDPRGRHVVIVDDLVQSGSTVIECQEKMLGLGL